MGTGKTQIIASGQATSNSFVYTGKTNVLGFGKTGVLIECVRLGSGVEYTIRGYPIGDFPKRRSITSGTILVSGASAYKVFSDPYDQIDVGIKSVQSNYTGAVTIYTTGKRRQ